jgi:phosphatidylinositol alpha-mannosyltransferase
MRIVLTHVSAWPEVRRGGERYLHELASALQMSGHDVRIITTAKRSHHEVVLGVPVWYLPRRELMRRRFGALASEAAFGLKSQTRLLPSRTDVWHALGTADAAAAALAGRVRRWRSVYTSLGFPMRASRERRPDARLHRVVVRDVDHYICLSRSTGQYLVDDYGRQPIVLGGGVDVSRFTPQNARSPIPSLLFAGALDESRKNLPLLLEAAAILRRTLPKFELWLSGPGDPGRLLAEAPSAARDVVRVLGVGTPDSLIDLYGSAWVTVLPAENEAFGLVLVESLACGTPIATLDSGGPSELVRPGIGVRAARSPEALAVALAQGIELAADPETTGACRAAALAHDWRTAIVPKLEALYLSSHA